MSGLVGTLRAINADDPVELHDLGGYDAAQVAELVQGAFAQPFPARAPVKVSFVVGAGKKGRQKYSQSLPKDLISALGSIGFGEDRAASACLECCGTYKYQHDTDKDLKFLHVFPHVSPGQGEGSEGEGSGEEGYDEDEDSPEEICRRISLEELEDFVKHNVKKFSQKRILLMKLKGFRAEFEELEAKMMIFGPLDPKEDAKYNNCFELSEKIEWVSGEMERMVTEGRLTKGEISLVREQLSDKVAQLSQELERAKADGKTKKAAKIDEAIERILDRKDSLAELKPTVYKIKHEKEIRQLRRQLAEIAKLEGSGGKQLMDVATVRKIGQKEELQEELDDLMQDNLGWFETKASVEEMMPSAAGGKKPKPKPKAAAGGGWTTKSSKKTGKSKGGSSRSGAPANPFDLLGDEG